MSSSVKRAVPLRSVAGTGSWDSGRGRAWGAELPFLSCPARGGVAVKPGGVGWGPRGAASDSCAFDRCRAPWRTGSASRAASPVCRLTVAAEQAAGLVGRDGTFR